MVKKEKQAEFTKWFGPLLDALRSLGGSGRPKEVSAQIAKDLKIPDQILEETMKSGGSKFQNQVAWARQYLVWEGCLDASIKGVWTLTPKGAKTSVTNEEARTIFLKWVDIFQKARKDKTSIEIAKQQEQEKPENLEHNLTPDLLSVLQNISPKGFEDVCKRLYGNMTLKMW